jgi:hypothetical protein
MTKKNDRKKIGKKGGEARAESLTPTERSEIARHAALARWNTGGDGLLPTATHEGVLKIGDRELPCYVLDDGRRVLSTRGVQRAMGSKKTGINRPSHEEPGAPQLPAFIAAQNVLPFVSEDLMARLKSPIVFRMKRSGIAFGYDAKLLPDICDVVLDARDTLKSTQHYLVTAAEIIIRGLARVGITALVDEATGYEADKARDELQKLLAQYIAAELVEWTRRFPNDFFKQVYRIYGWKYQPGITKGPRYVGKFIKKYIYGKLPPGVLEELEAKNPADDKGRRKFKHFQWLTEHTGHPHLDAQIVKVTTILQLSDSKGEFNRNFAKAFPEPGQQTELALPPVGDDEDE